MSVFVVLLSVYFGLNFACALALHHHAQGQAHLRLRFLDVLVHFVLLTAFALPALLVVTLMAFFGSEDKPLAKTAGISPAARAA